MILKLYINNMHTFYKLHFLNILICNKMYLHIYETIITLVNC